MIANKNVLKKLKMSYIIIFIALLPGIILMFQLQKSTVTYWWNLAVETMLKLSRLTVKLPIELPARNVKAACV